MSQPKTLLERLEWMSINLPGFGEEIEFVRAIQQYSNARSGVLVRPLQQACMCVVVQSVKQANQEGES